MVGNGLLGNQMNIPTARKHRSVLAKVLTHKAFNLIPRHSIADFFTDRDTQSAAVMIVAFIEADKVLILQLFPVFEQKNELPPLEKPIGSCKSLP